MRAGLPSTAEAAQVVRAGLQVMRTEVLPRAERAVGVARARWLFRAFHLGQGVAAYGPVAARNDGHAELGDKLTFLGGMLPTSVVCYENARLVVGAETQFNYGVSLEAWESVQIGARCMFASFVRVSDRDGQRIAPIIIEDDVWVAHGAILLPGVRIGARSVVSAGSIVSQDVPPDSLAMGNPARSMSLDLVAREATGS
ncbi:acyltransferase [Corallococcus praedator]|uniref:Acyltransferase n=1 Tax=Corallococcus praedator TaxID=2316724 RepID=A0ABX9QTH2_9BACT|nr:MULTISPECIES: acyltransferase [Corallococcus]RKH21401.1 acyltransferase [Corallococcus sp. CA047B]RKH35053.1 acyltransferase [Corallococcus sp. CA031C]RKI17337.1 acyltransferase [Corallococcus praedator]